MAETPTPPSPAEAPKPTVETPKTASPEPSTAQETTNTQTADKLQAETTAPGNNPEKTLESFAGGDFDAELNKLNNNELPPAPQGGESPNAGELSQPENSKPSPIDEEPASNSENDMQKTENQGKPSLPDNATINDILNDDTLTPAQRAEKIRSLQENQLSEKPSTEPEKPANDMNKSEEAKKRPSNEDLVAQETQLQQDLKDGKLTQEQYHQKMSELAEQTHAGVALTPEDVPHYPGENVKTYTVEGAQYHEPTAEERTAGATVEPKTAVTEAPTNPDETPTEAPKANETTTTSTESSKPTETSTEGAEAPKTPEQEAVEQNKKLMELGIQLGKIGIDPNSEQGKQILDAVAQNPDLAESLSTITEKLANNNATEAAANAARSAQKTTEEIQELTEKAENDPDAAEKLKKKKILLIILATLLATAAVAVGGATALSLAGVAGAGAMLRKGAS